MKSTTVFNFKGNDVRTTIKDGEPMFCLADVCRALDIANPRDCKNRLNPDGVGTTDIIDSMGRTQQATFISEQNLYKVIFQSRKTEAEAFTDWVTGEVLPAIRKTGTYSCDPVVRKFVEEVQKKASAQVRRDLAAARNAAITSLQNAGYSVDLDLIKSFTLENCESNPAMQKQQQNKIIKQIVDPRFVATVKMEIESKEP